MALYVMGYTAGRVWIEALRTDHANHFLGLRLNDWTSLIVFLLGLAWFLRHGGFHAEREPTPYYRTEADDDGADDVSDGADDVSDDAADAATPLTGMRATTGRGRGRRRRSRPMTDSLADIPPLPNPEVHHQHRDVSGGWLRPTVFGMMDGLVSNFALIAGVAGASTSTTGVALAGWAGLVGGAFSMATGEYVSVQSQNESTQAELDVERHELRHNADGRAGRTDRDVRRARGRPGPGREVARQLSRDPDQALLIHAQEELGVDPKQLPSPWTAAYSSLVAFSVGAFVPLLPYLLGATTLWISAVLALVALFVAGVGASRFTSRSWLYAGLRQLILGVLAAGGHLRRRLAVPRRRRLT